MDAAIEQLCNDAIAAGLFPGCSVGYIAGGVSTTAVFGRQTYALDSPLVTPDTVYDVASVTKSVVTASLALKLVETGQLDLDDRVINYVPELENPWQEQLLIRHLLTYTVIFDLPNGHSGLAAEDPAHFFDRLIKTPLKAEPGTMYAYTNGPAILLGAVIEELTDQSLEAAAQEKLFVPLGMTSSGYGVGLTAGARTAPAELTDNEGDIRGRVHDESAAVMADCHQLSGAAGLFSTAPDLLRFAGMLLNKGFHGDEKIFEPETVTAMHTNQIAALGKFTGLGWELNQPLFMGSQAVDIFGKTGFTGCIMMINPRQERALVHLSNRLYPHRPADRVAINTFRAKLADIVFAI